MPERRSIPTIYKNIRFRSKLEADWARAFDALGVEWKYESEGHYFGDVFYLPDFYLPQSRQYIEVKAVFEPNDVRKIRALLKHLPPRKYTEEDQPDIPLIACMPNGVFYGWSRSAKTIDWFAFLTKAAVGVELAKCSTCGGWWFMASDWGWNCQCCGKQGGNTNIERLVESPIVWPPTILPRDPFYDELRA